MVKNCKVSLTLGRMGCFHFLAPGKRIRKITSDWGWRELVENKKKMKQESGADKAECCPTKTQHHAPWANCCHYLSNFFIQLNKDHPDLRWECAPAAPRKGAGKSLARHEAESGARAESRDEPRAGLAAACRPLRTPSPHPALPLGRSTASVATCEPSAQD